MPAAVVPIDYQTVFHALPENFLLIGADPDATILDNTDSHVAVSLKSREEAIGKPFFEAYPASSESGAAEIRASHEHVRRYLEPHTMPLIRYDLAGPDGQLEEYYWQATHYPVLNAQGQLQYILQRTQNVTEQLRIARLAEATRQELAAEQARTQFVLANLPVLVWTATPDGQRDYFNARWLTYTGAAPGAHLGEGWLDAIHPDDRERVQQQWHASVASGRPYQVEYRLRRHDGEYRWMLSRATADHAPGGEVRLWVGGVVDVHEERRMVREILEANEEQALLSDQAYQNFKLVQQQRHMLYNVLLHAPAYIAIMRGPEHRYEFVSEQFLKFTNGQPVIGRTVAEVFPETVGQGLIASLDRVLQTGEPYRGHERRLLLRDEHGQPREYYFSFYYDCFEEDGERAGITSYAYDVTELVQLRQRLATSPASPSPEG